MMKKKIRRVKNIISIVMICLMVLTVTNRAIYSGYDIADTEEKEEESVVQSYPSEIYEWPEVIEPPQVVLPDPVEEEDEEVDIIPSPYVISLLTGLEIMPEDYLLRPVAIVINNMHPARPQSGLSQADIIYEVLAEGNITRLVAIFQAFDAAKIGPVRSARDYFIHFALNHDALFVHHGGSDGSYIRLRELGIDRLDGMNLEGRYFWRDRSYPEWDTQHTGQTRSMEHSSYTSAENIALASEGYAYRTDTTGDMGIGFKFREEGYVQRGSITHEVIIPFALGYERIFKYNPTENIYEAYNKDGPHIDENNRETIEVANIIIQMVTSRVIDGEGRRDVGTIGSGTGYLLAEGYIMPVYWDKEDHFAPTRWYFENGDDMLLAPGKTWVCVLQENVQIIYEKILNEGGTLSLDPVLYR